ncbi:sensor histidine kinase [Aquirufa nivalisilvae]|uniref:sensor histidine kinase n=1 Tax=Aquirufa nivalisilvae TaxID=2516557 RepID=UPI0022A97965|nr:ATP-binding protein [Aquirufa nivalisilvae]MCZ2478698.1 two-component sensor histidine kinase [Aquirufa nivalisilvae]
MLSPRYLSLLLAFVIAGVCTSFLSFLPNTDFTILFISFISSFIFGSAVIYFALDNLVFKEVNKLYDRIKQIKKKNFSVIPRKLLIEKENPIELLKEELNSYVTTKEDEVKELKKAAKYRQEFLADVSHELKTPIFAAQGFVHTLLDNPEEDPEIRKRFLEKAAKSLDGLDILVKDLLTVSQIETGAIKIDKKALDLKPLVIEIFEQLEAKAKAKNIELKLIGHNGPVLVKADYQRISQVLVNLIDNGIKYGHQDGKVTVQLEEKKKAFLVMVKDNGPGVPAEHLPRLFERFYRVDKSRAKMSGGSGLGLSIVKHIIQAHNSKIAVFSKIDKGTSFQFKLEKA